MCLLCLLRKERGEKLSDGKPGFIMWPRQRVCSIFLSEVDYLTKTAGVFHSFTLTGEKDATLPPFRSPIKSIRGRHPELQYPPYWPPYARSAC